MDLDKSKSEWWRWTFALLDSLVVIVLYMVYTSEMELIGTEKGVLKNWKFNTTFWNL